MKKILAILLTVCMVIWTIPATVFATTAPAPTSWNTTASSVATTDYKSVDTNNDGNVDCAEIYTNIGLAYYFKNLSTNSLDAKLMNNVDMSKYNANTMTWDITVSNYAKTFDGNGKTITGLDGAFVGSISNGGGC